jgi:hypothetical protein
MSILNDEVYLTAGYVPPLHKLPMYFSISILKLGSSMARSSLIFPLREISTRLSYDFQPCIISKSIDPPIMSNHQNSLRYRQSLASTHPSNLGSQMLATQSREGSAKSTTPHKLVIAVQPVRSYQWPLHKNHCSPALNFPRNANATCSFKLILFLFLFLLALLD